MEAVQPSPAGLERFGLALENFTPADREPDFDTVLAYARRAEELGYASIWAWDHLLLGTRRPFPFLESLTTLAALATATTRVRLGTGVLVLPLRNPLVLAKATATLDRISHGRLTLGLAGGWYEREFQAAGIAFKRRGRIFEHNLEALEAFWSGDPVSGEQDGIAYRDALMLPRPTQRPRPKLLIGGYVETVLRRAATRSDGWLTYFYTPESFASAWKKVRDFAEAAGRDPDELENVAQLPIYVADDYETADRRCREYVDAYCDLPEWSESSVESSIRGTPEQCAEQLADHFRAGVQHVCLCPADYEIEQIERIAAQVLPLVDDVPVGAG
jgi:probable F420-dependent oxidoreductase